MHTYRKSRPWRRASSIRTFVCTSAEPRVCRLPDFLHLNECASIFYPCCSMSLHKYPLFAGLPFGIWLSVSLPIVYIISILGGTCNALQIPADIAPTAAVIINGSIPASEINQTQVTMPQVQCNTPMKFGSPSASCEQAHKLFLTWLLSQNERITVGHRGT